MSVLIKGFEMPKDGCKDCAMVKRGNVFDICPFLKQEVNGNVERGGKPNGCPLINVPDKNVGDTISRQAVIDAMEKCIMDCNPDHFVSCSNFIEYMHDAEIGSFGQWQFANGFNMGVTASKVAINLLHSTQPEQRWIPWEKLERYAEFFCADVPYTEFVREAKQFLLDAERSEDE